MKHSGPNDMAIFSRNLRQLGYALRMDRHGVTVVKPFFGLWLVKKRTTTLYQAHLWTRDQINKMRGREIGNHKGNRASDGAFVERTNAAPIG